MVEKKKVPHLDLTLSLRRQPGAAQLIKKAVKSGQSVNVLGMVKQYEEYFDEHGHGEAHLDLYQLAVEPSATVPDFVKRAIDDVYDVETGPAGSPPENPGLRLQRDGQIQDQAMAGA